MRATTRSAARSSSSTIRHLIAARSARACGVQSTFKAEVAQYPVYRDQARSILRLRQSALDLFALQRSWSRSIALACSANLSSGSIRVLMTKECALPRRVVRRTLQTKLLSYIQPSCYIFGQFFESVGNRKIRSDIFAASDGVNFANS